MGDQGLVQDRLRRVRVEIKNVVNIRSERPFSKYISTFYGTGRSSLDLLVILTLTSVIEDIGEIGPAGCFG